MSSTTLGVVFIVSGLLEIGIPLAGIIQDDELLSEYDAAGKPLIDLPDTSTTVQKLEEIVTALDI